MSDLKRKTKDFGKKYLRNIFELGQQLGFDILPRHFYSEIPNIRELKKENVWKEPHSMTGVNGKELKMQLEFVKECCGEGLQEILQEEDIYLRACSDNGEPGFGFVESSFLFCFIYTKRPRKIVQIGCGVSTSVILMAIQAAKYDGEIICIEPYPTDFLKKIHQSGKIKLITEKCQNVPLEILTNLGEEGLLFIDSTHTVKPGSEVNMLILEVLPRLKPTTYVHFHDIYFPYDYQRGILNRTLFFWNESVLLHAFLINNQKCLLKVALSMLHYACPEEIKKFLPHYNPSPSEFGMELEGFKGHFPSSAYLQIID